jgi:hypothetical protein
MELRQRVPDSDTRVQGWLEVAMSPLSIFLLASTLLALALRNEPGLSDDGSLTLSAFLLIVSGAVALTGWVHRASQGEE